MEVLEGLRLEMGIVGVVGLRGLRVRLIVLEGVEEEVLLVLLTEGGAEGRAG